MPVTWYESDVHLSPEHKYPLTCTVVSMGNAGPHLHQRSSEGCNLPAHSAGAKRSWNKWLKLQTASCWPQIIMLVVSVGNMFNVAAFLLVEATKEKSLDVLE